MAKSKVTDNRSDKSIVKASRGSRKKSSGEFVSVNLASKMPTGATKETITDRIAKRPKASAASSAEMLVENRFLSSDGLVDVDRVADFFGMTKASLAETLGFANDTLQRFSRASAPKTQQRLREMLEILTRVEPWAGGMPQALGWYRGQGIPALGDQTAEALVKSDQAVLVRRYLDGLAAGSFA
jgi:hypothetical protein